MCGCVGNEHHCKDIRFHPTKAIHVFVYGVCSSAFFFLRQWVQTQSASLASTSVSGVKIILLRKKNLLQLISFGEDRRWGELNYKTPVTCCGNLICDEIPCLSVNAYFGGILSGTGSEPIRHRGYVSSTSSRWSPLCRPSGQLPDMHIGMLHAYVNTECSHTKCMDIISKALLNFWLI